MLPVSRICRCTQVLGTRNIAHHGLQRSFATAASDDPYKLRNMALVAHIGQSQNNTSRKQDLQPIRQTPARQR